MISSLATALSSLNAAKDIAQAMISLRDTAAFQQKLIEFQGKIIDANNAAFAAQDERSALLEEVRQLKEEVTRLEAWNAEKERYELKDVCDGSAFAYVLRDEAKGTEPIHWLCASCYQQGKKSILQKKGEAADRAGRLPYWGCPECESKIIVRYNVWPGNPATV